MTPDPRVFLDTSALFAAIWSADGGARAILELAEARAIHLLVSPQVLAEIEEAVRRKLPGMLGTLALLLDHTGVTVLPVPSEQVVAAHMALTGHAGDAHVVAAARCGQVDYFVSLDRKHFLDNTALRAALPFPIGTPGDFLAWYRAQLLEAGR
jgi:predicted nucleic acid-binding protein